MEEKKHFPVFSVWFSIINMTNARQFSDSYYIRELSWLITAPMTELECKLLGWKQHRAGLIKMRYRFWIEKYSRSYQTTSVSRLPLPRGRWRKFAWWFGGSSWCIHGLWKIRMGDSAPSLSSATAEQQGRILASLSEPGCFIRVRKIIELTINHHILFLVKIQSCLQVSLSHLSP